jgi:hypothetical protein
LRQAYRRQRIQLEGAAVHVQIGVRERTLRRAARIGHKDVYAPRPFLGRANEAPCVLVACHVGRDAKDLRARLARDARGRLCDAPLVARADKDARAFAGQFVGRGVAYAAARGGNERDAPADP